VPENNEQPANELEALKAQMEQMQAMMQEFTAQITPYEVLDSSLEAAAKDAYNEYLARVNKINAERQEIKQKVYEFQRDKNKLQWELNQLAQKQAKLEEEERKKKQAEEEAKKWAEEVERWERLTMGAPWREWAKDHQLEAGTELTWNRRVILADTMGLGKTLSSIIALDKIQAATTHASPESPFGGEDKQVFDYDTREYITKRVGGVEKPCGKKVLYFCPATMVGNVEREFKRWTKHRTVLNLGGIPKAERNFALQLAQMHPEYTVILNYEAWRKDFNLLKMLSDCEFDTVIIDEAHNIKNRSSAAYRGVKHVVDNTSAPFVFPMTGTPILNRPQELFSILTLINPKDFHNERIFLQNYCQQNMDNKWVFQPGGMDRLGRRIRKNFLRRTKEQAGIILPERTINVHDIQVDEENWPRQAEVRKQMRDHAMIVLDPDKGTAINAAIRLVEYTRLRQIETWPAGIVVKETDKSKDSYGEVILKVDVEESQKIDYLIRWDADSQEWEGLIPEVIQDERAIVFSQFIPPLDELGDRCRRMGIRPAFLRGGMTNEQKDEVLMDFDNTYTPNRKDAKYDIVLAHYKAGGEGANLTAATQMFILDEQWNPGKRDQAYDRFHRMGQDKPVTIHVLRDNPSIDNWLAGIIAQKESVVDEFITGMDHVKEFYEAMKSGLI
jgi:SNF2 family DNA or RNA helicase